MSRKGGVTMTKDPIEKMREAFKGVNDVGMMNAMAAATEHLAERVAKLEAQSPAIAPEPTPVASPSASPPPGFVFSETPGHVDHVGRAFAWCPTFGFLIKSTGYSLLPDERWLIPATVPAGAGPAPRPAGLPDFWEVDESEDGEFVWEDDGDGDWGCMYWSVDGLRVCLMDCRATRESAVKAARMDGDLLLKPRGWKAGT